MPPPPQLSFARHLTSATKPARDACSFHRPPPVRIVDRLGIRTSLRLGAALSTLARLSMVYTTNPRLYVLVVATVLPLGEAFGIPGAARPAPPHPRVSRGMS